VPLIAEIGSAPRANGESPRRKAWGCYLLGMLGLWSVPPAAKAVVQPDTGDLLIQAMVVHDR
jgi:hypothetical protein